jgi:hypothetical protein
VKASGLPPAAAAFRRRPSRQPPIGYFIARRRSAQQYLLIRFRKVSCHDPADDEWETIPITATMVPHRERAQLTSVL